MKMATCIPLMGDTSEPKRPLWVRIHTAAVKVPHPLPRTSLFRKATELVEVENALGNVD